MYTVLYGDRALFTGRIVECLKYLKTKRARGFDWANHCAVVRS